MASGFFDPAEQRLMAQFLDQGYVIAPAADPTALARLRDFVAASAADQLGQAPPDAAGAFLDAIHDRLAAADLNPFRLAVFQALAAQDWARPAYFRLARPLLEALVGNELAMQRRINLSIQLPGDDGSLLPLHADSWSGDSPYEVVVWVPLVDCHDSKSLFIVPRPADRRLQPGLSEFAVQGVEAFYRHIEPHAQFLEVPYGQVLLFSQNLMHGNRVNREAGSRWSLNCRFKALLTPYADKGIGEFFEPITLRPATRLGAAYSFPEGFGD